MSERRVFPLVFAAVLVVSPVAATAGLATRPATATTPTRIDGCTTISSPGSYLLTSDVATNETGDCIRITAPGVVLDGGGHTLSGPWNVDYDPYAAAVNVTADNVTVEHLTATGWSRGVTVVGSAEAVSVSDVTVQRAYFGVMLGRFSGTNGSVVTDSFFDDVKVGVRISFRGRNNTVSNVTTGFDYQDSIVVLGKAQDNVVRGNDVDDVKLDAATGTRVVDNELNSLTLEYADENLVAGNVVNSRIDVVQGSDGNTLRNNTVGGGVVGIEISRSQGNAVVENTVTGATFQGVSVFDAPNTTVRANHLDTNGTGIAVTSYAPVTVENNTLTGNADGGIGIGDAEQVSVVGNRLWNNSEFGVRVWSSSDSVLRDNEVTGSPMGVTVERSSDVSVDGLAVTNASDTAVTVLDATNITLVDATLDRSDAGIYAGTSTGIRVVDTRVGDVDGYGALFDESETVTVRNATFRRNNYGLRLLGVTNATVTDTTAPENARAGVRVTGGNDTRLRNVSTTGNGVAGVRLDDVNRSTVERVTADGNAYGVRVTGSRDVLVRGVTARTNTYAGVRLFEATNVTVVSSRATGNRFGLKLVSSAGATVTDTVASGNDRAGVRVTDDSWKDRGAGEATDTRLEDVTARNNGVSGVRLVSTTGTVVRNVTVTGDDSGVWLTATTDTRLVGIDASDNAAFDVLVASGGSVTARDVSLGDGTVVAFDGTDVTVDTATQRPTAPTGYADVDRYVEVGRTSADATLDLTVAYSDAAVDDAGVEESTLRLWQYDDDWTDLGGSVDESANTVSATVSQFGLVAPLGETAETTTTSTDNTTTTAEAGA